MNEGQANQIILLLFAILVVLVYGADSAASAFGWVVGVGVAFVVIRYVFLNLSHFVRVCYREIEGAYEKREPWIWQVIIWLGLLSSIPVIASAGFTSLNGGIPFSRALANEPYLFVPGSFYLLTSIVWILERGVVSAAKICLDWCVAVARNWYAVFKGPIERPAAEWRYAQEMRLRGYDTSRVKSTFWMLYAVFESILLWVAFVLFPLGIIAMVVALNMQKTG